MSSHRLWEIPQLIEDAEDFMCNPETGEMLTDEEIKAYVDALQMEADAKVKYFSLDALNLNAEIDAMKNQKKMLDGRIKTAERKLDWIKRYVSTCLKGEKWKADDGSVAVSYRNTKDAVKVNCIEDVPSEWFKTPHYESNLNKTAIKEALKNGTEIPGVQLEDRVSVIIK